MGRRPRQRRRRGGEQRIRATKVEGLSVSNRREFLQSCAAIAGGLAASRAFADAPFPADRFMPQRAIFDAAFVEGHAFARAARDLGMTTHAISGDVTALWYNDLYFHWRHDSGVVAGLTGASALFCLERLAWDVGHRVVLRVNHAPAPEGGVRHTLLGPREMLRSSVSVLKSSQLNWGARMAQLTMQCPTRTAGRERRSVVDGSGSTDRWCESLVSWVIAPRSNV
jgi:hypothetical protein